MIATKNTNGMTQKTKIQIKSVLKAAGKWYQHGQCQPHLSHTMVVYNEHAGDDKLSDQLLYQAFKPSERFITILM